MFQADTEEVLVTYGERLRELRAEQRLSLRQVEERGGPNKDTMSLIERDVHRPHPQTLGRIAQALDMSVAELRSELEAAEHPKGAARFSAGRALRLADSDSVRREAKRASVEELQQASLELARFTKPQTHEELVRNRGNKEYRRESHRRVIAHERLGIIQGELAERGAPSPVELVVKRHNDAMTTAEETARAIPTEREGQEAGEAS
jgi:transcriptional regulator with XRE-family HTH domain